MMVTYTAVNNNFINTNKCFIKFSNGAEDKEMKSKLVKWKIS